MSCINFSVVVYPLSFPSASCTSRTVLAPWRHSTARMAISASVGSGGGSGSLERRREAMHRVLYEFFRMSTKWFVCLEIVGPISVMNVPPLSPREGDRQRQRSRHTPDDALTFYI